MVKVVLAEYPTLGGLNGDHLGTKIYDPLYIDASCKRSVQLILIEFIPGLPVRDANPHGMPRELRQPIMKSLIEVETLLYSKYLAHQDIHPVM